MKTVRIVAMIGILWFSSSAPCFAQWARILKNSEKVVKTGLKIWKVLREHPEILKEYLKDYHFWGKYPRKFQIKKNEKFYYCEGEQLNVIFIPVYVDNLHQTTENQPLLSSKADPPVVITEWDLPFWDAFGGKLLLLVLFFFLLASWASQD